MEYEFIEFTVPESRFIPFTRTILGLGSSITDIGNTGFIPVPQHESPLVTYKIVGAGKQASQDKSFKYYYRYQVAQITWTTKNGEEWISAVNLAHGRWQVAYSGPAKPGYPFYNLLVSNIPPPASR